MKTDLRSKFFDDILSAVILTLVMYPLTIMFRFLEEWGTTSHRVATILFMVAGTWMLFRATQEKLSEIGRAWYGLIGGLLAWTATELSHELSLIDIENWDFLVVLAMLIGFLVVLWKYFPIGAKFWVVIFVVNWVGHVFIHVVQEFFGGALFTTIFTISAAAFGLLIIGLIFWIFARTTTHLQCLWCGL